MSDKKNPVLSLVSSICRSKNSADLLDKIGEVPLDKLLDEGVLREIPIIGTAISIFKAGDDVRAYFFAKKIASFLSETETVSEEDRNKFFETHCSDDKAKSELGESTLMVLDKIDNAIITRLLGHAFAIMLKGDRGCVENFEFHSFVIKNLNSYLIRQIRGYYAHAMVGFIDSIAAVELANFGLVKVVTSSQIGNSYQVSTQKTDLGAFFYKMLKEVDAFKE